MAIRPVDLQLSYMAAPQNAAVLSSAQEGPQAAQQAAAAAFAAEAARREEQIGEPVKAQGAKVRAREERDPAGEDASQQQGRRGTQERKKTPEPLQFAGEGEHFIDVTA
jgi:hypothetical protein